MILEELNCKYGIYYEWGGLREQCPILWMTDIVDRVGEPRAQPFESPPIDEDIMRQSA